MVFFMISREAFKSYASLGRTDASVWVSAGVLTGEEVASFREQDVEVSDFNYSLEPSDNAGIQAAMETIREHHPGQTVWVGF